MLLMRMRREWYRHTDVIIVLNIIVFVISFKQIKKKTVILLVYPNRGRYCIPLTQLNSKLSVFLNIFTR